MGESGRDFGLEFMRKSKLKKGNFKLKKTRKLLNMIVPNFAYTNSMLLLVTRTARTQSFTFYKERFFGTFHLK